jgi:RimJ/RimL family protein N-acetyltransferase
MTVVIKTPRLVLRYYECRDIEELVRIYSSAAVSQFYRCGQTSSTIKEELVQEIVSREKIGEEKPFFGIWAIHHKEDNKCIGECGVKLVPVDGMAKEVVLEEALSFSYWGKGLALEAAAATRDYCFFELGIERLAAIIRPTNNPSIKLARSLFMEFERETEKGFHLYAVESRCWLIDARSRYFQKLEAALAG